MEWDPEVIDYKPLLGESPCLESNNVSRVHRTSFSPQHNPFILLRFVLLLLFAHILHPNFNLHSHVPSQHLPPSIFPPTPVTEIRWDHLKPKINTCRSLKQMPFMSDSHAINLKKNRKEYMLGFGR